MRVKRIISLLLMSLTVLSVLTSCTNEAEREEDSFETALPPVTLTFYMFEKDKKDTKEVLDKVAQSSNLNIILDFKWFGYEDYFRNVERAIASNDKLDAFICGKPVPGAIDFIEMFREGKIKNLTELLPQYAPNILSQLSDGDLNSVRIDGKIAFIPPILPMVDCLGVNIRKDLADKYNITSVNTFNEYENILEKIKENEKGIIPGTVRGGTNYNLELFANAFGYIILDNKLALVYKWDDPKMKVVPWEQTPEFKETANLVNSWVKNGYLEQVETLDKTGSFMGRFGTFEERTIDYTVKEGKKESFNYYLLYNNKKIQRKSPMNFLELCSIALSSNSENVERTLMFLNWVQSGQENYDLLMYGILEKHYLLKDGRVAMPEGVEEDRNPYYGWFSLPFRNANFDREWVDEYDPGNTMEDITQFLEKYTSYAPHEGFYHDYKDIRALCDNRMQLYRNKIEIELHNGTFDMEKADSIIEELEKAGTDRIVLETQRQLDNWKALNE
ncbi:MAG TPA: DUF3502 domain-containing protein [Clostridia bacterium]|nr:DUF3502 domain-containing protein [Clostridia bacterium]